MPSWKGASASRLLSLYPATEVEMCQCVMRRAPWACSHHQVCPWRGELRVGLRGRDHPHLGN